MKTHNLLFFLLLFEKDAEFTFGSLSTAQPPSAKKADSIFTERIHYPRNKYLTRYTS